MESAGKINEYVCEKCGKPTRTINAVDGVTPFMIRCRPAIPGTCDGMAQSSLYRVEQQSRPMFEWYRPDDAELAAIEDEVEAQWWRDHVNNGGLKMRRVTHETLEAFGYGLRSG